LQTAFPNELARLRQLARLRRFFWFLRHDRTDHPEIVEEDELLFAQIEHDLGLSAQALEGIAPGSLTAPDFQGIPQWYPRMLATYLRMMLTEQECDLVRGQHRAGVSVDRIAERVTRERLRVFAGFLPQLADAFKYDSYAKLSVLDRELLQLIMQLPHDYLDKLHDYVWRHDSPVDQTPGEAPENNAGSTRDADNDCPDCRLLEALRKPSIVSAAGSGQDGDAMVCNQLKEVSCVLGEIYFDEELPDGDRWTEPLLRRIADQRSAPVFSSPSARE
jgi:hypothetical protein